MQKLLFLSALTLMPAIGLNAQTEILATPEVPNQKVMEMHQALEVTKEAYKKAKKAEKNEANKAKHEAERIEFWEQVENRKAKKSEGVADKPKAQTVETNDVKTEIGSDAETPVVAASAVTTPEANDGMLKRAMDALLSLFR